MSLGAILGRLGAVLDRLGAPWGRLIRPGTVVVRCRAFAKIVSTLSWAVGGRVEAIPGRSQIVRLPSLDLSCVVQRVSQAVWGASCPVLGKLWAVLAAVGGSPEPSWARLGAIRGRSGRKSGGGKNIGKTHGFSMFLGFRRRREGILEPSGAVAEPSWTDWARCGGVAGVR